MSTRAVLTATAAALAAVLPAGVVAAGGGHDPHVPRLEGRAVLPVATYSDGPPAGAALVPAGSQTTVINGIQFPTPSQPVEGFSGIVEGRRRGEWLAMADNGFGSKANSKDFHIRAYVLRPDFKTARGGTGGVEVGPYIEFTDPNHLIGFPIQHEGIDRVLTGADIDPESIQRGRDGTLWVGDEFGPWVLHFDADGRLLDAPYELPDGLTSVNHPTTPGPVPNSGGFEAMAMSPNGRSLYAILEKRLPDDPVGIRRVYEFDTRHGTFARLADYEVEVVGATTANPDPILVADAQALDSHRLLLIERDNTGGGLAATYRKVYRVDLRDVAHGTLRKREVVDLTAIPDPDHVSLPPIHSGDVGLGDPYGVTCESIEALHVVSHHRLLLGCDNNFPNSGRNPNLADDSELITVGI
jgi:glycerophosphoryl diester phosphodiesterase